MTKMRDPELVRFSNMIIGTTISGTDNDAYFFDKVPNGVLCPSCGYCLDFTYAPSKIDLSENSHYDISSTHDHRRIFSRRFVNFIVTELHFCGTAKKISANKDLYYLYPNTEVHFYYQKRGTRFEKRCLYCGGYESIVGATPVYLLEKQIPRERFCRTDLSFGSGKEKFPLFIVDCDASEAIRRQNFKGIIFKDVLS
jgi:hypothetical protein